MIHSFTPLHNSANTFYHSPTNPSCRPNSFTYSILMHYGPDSIAEQTLSAHRSNQNQVADPDKPLVQKGSLFSPQNPGSKYVSKYPVSFRGCLDCGDPNHLFRNYPQRSEKSVRHLFWQEMLTHILATRKKGLRQQQSDSRSITFSGFTNTLSANIDSVYTYTTSVPSSAGVGRTVNNLPVWMTTRPSESNIDADKPESSNVKPWFLPIMARITAMDVITCLSMPIQINNKLPCVDVCLGKTETKELWMRMRVDSGAAMNSGNKRYHQQAM